MINTMTKYSLRLLKYSSVTLTIIILSIGLYVGSAILIAKISSTPEVTKNTEIEIFILTNGVHTDIVMPIKSELIDWSEYFKYENTLSQDTSYKYVAIGWGDKGFYLETPTWGDLTAKVALKAAFGISTSAIHSTFYHKMQENSECISLNLSRDQYQRLIKYVLGSLQISDQNQLIHIETDANYGSNDAFYEAIGSYSFFHTCNTWANNGLLECGQKACIWTIFDTGIFNHYNYE